MKEEIRFGICCGTCNYKEILEDKKNYLRCLLRDEIVEVINVCNKFEHAEFTKIKKKGTESEEDEEP